MISKEATKTSRRLRSVRSGNAKLSSFTIPMMASLSDHAFDDAEWIFEVKWDGYRAIADIGKEIKLYSRNGLSFLQLYPKVANELKKFKSKIVIDGEIVVLNEKGKPDFQKLQQYDAHQHLPILFYVFDCLSFEGKSLINLPLTERKAIAKKALPASNIIQFSDHVEGAGVECFRQAVKMDLEGIIAKRARSLYTPGKRSRDWLKIKNHNTQEAIIAGYTSPRGSRNHFGALILGIMKNGKLEYIGHTGTGFTAEILKDVYQKLQPLKRSSSPFSKKIPVNAPVTWVEPVLVCNIKFTEMTADNIFRHPVFQGLRIDKSASEANKLNVVAENVKSNNKT